MPDKFIRVLIVDDSTPDARLMEAALERGGYEIRAVRVETAADMRDALARQSWDIVLSDYRMPEFSGLEAIEVLRASGQDIPLVMVSGAIGEEVAVAATKAGACDYVMKNNLPRLPGVVAAELRDAVRRRAALTAQQEELRQAAARMRFLFTSNPAVIFSCEPSGTYALTFISENIKAAAGYDPSECLAQSDFWIRNIHADDVSAVLKDMSRLFETGHYDYECRYRHKDGSWRWMRAAMNLIRDAQGNPTEIIGSTVDITDTREAVESLKHSEERYRSLVEMFPEAILAHEEGGKVLYANSAAVRLFAVGGEGDLVGRNIFDYMPPEQRAAVARSVQMLKEGGFASDSGDQKILRPGGGEADIEAAGCRVTYQGKPAVQVVLRDVTQRRKLQRQYIQAQKLEAVGLLAGGIAHDFRNQLTVIRGYAEMLDRSGLVKDKGKTFIREILQAVDRSATMTGQLLAFSRRQVLQPQVVSPDQLIAGLSKTLSRMVGEDIRLSILPGSAGCVKIDPGQLEAALLNMAVNARDAMPQGGQLTIQTADVDLDEEFALQNPGASPGPHIMVAVSDTGVGMDEETARQVFEPFFTTKPAWQGTGLGLAMVYGFVQQSGGTIGVASRPGQGTTFRIYLPRVAAVALPLPPVAAWAPLPPGKGTILLVEDEEAIRALVARTLRECGYEVLEAPAAAAAIAICESMSDALDLLVSDVVMPGMSGPELVKIIRQRRPDLPVLYLSGYTGKALSDHGVPADVNLLTKPFDAHTLVSAVRKLVSPPGN